MNTSLLIIITFIITTNCAKPKDTVVNQTVSAANTKKIEDPEKIKPPNRTLKVTSPEKIDVISILPRKKIVETIDPDT